MLSKCFGTYVFEIVGLEIQYYLIKLTRCRTLKLEVYNIYQCFQRCLHTIHNVPLKHTRNLLQFLVGGAIKDLKINQIGALSCHQLIYLNYLPIIARNFFEKLCSRIFTDVIGKHNFSTNLNFFAYIASEKDILREVNALGLQEK